MTNTALPVKADGGEIWIPETTETLQPIITPDEMRRNARRTSTVATVFLVSGLVLLGVLTYIPFLKEESHSQATATLIMHGFPGLALLLFLSMLLMLASVILYGNSYLGRPLKELLRPRELFYPNFMFVMTFVTLGMCTVIFVMMSIAFSGLMTPEIVYVKDGITYQGESKAQNIKDGKTIELVDKKTGQTISLEQTNKSTVDSFFISKVTYSYDLIKEGELAAPEEQNVFVEKDGRIIEKLENGTIQIIREAPDKDETTK